MSSDPIAVLEAIVAEVAGAGQPFSADSYLPPHLVHDARQAIEAEHKDAAEWKAREAYEALLLARLEKSDAIVRHLREQQEGVLRYCRDVDSAGTATERAAAQTVSRMLSAPPEITDKEKSAILGKYGSTPEETDVPDGRFVVLMKRLAKADEVIASLRAEIDALRHPKIPGTPPGAMFGPGMAAPNPLVFDPAGRFADPSRTLKYDPDACAESVRDMKECDA